MKFVRKLKAWLHERKEKRNQRMFIYCPKCNNEMIWNGHFVEDNDGIIKYKCSKCGNISFWDFAHFPAPILRSCQDCSHCRVYDFGIPYCKERFYRQCSPDTQIKFTYKQ